MKKLIGMMVLAVAVAALTSMAGEACGKGKCGGKPADGAASTNAPAATNAPASAQ